MERKDLLEANGAIFTVQGRCLSENAARDVRILVVGNPANTNCLIAMNNAPGIPGERFSAMMRLDHNRAKAQLAAKTARPVADVSRMTIWGNHSATQYPDVVHARVAGGNALEVVGDQAWVEKEFIPTVQQRGASIIEARGASSAASAASAAIDHMRDWMTGSPDGDWVSMAIASTGDYGVPDGLVSGFPVTTEAGQFRVVAGLDIDDFSRERIDATVAELIEERDTVHTLGLLGG
jgi:malate dehydrogenase